MRINNGNRSLVCMPLVLGPHDLRSDQRYFQLLLLRNLGLGLGVPLARPVFTSQVGGHNSSMYKHVMGPRVKVQGNPFTT